MSATGGQADDLDIWKLLGVVRRRFALIGTVAVAIFALAVVLVLGITPRYSSEAQILIENSESAFTRPQGETAAALAADQAAVLSEVQVLLSRDLAAKVSERTGLAEVDEFSGQGLKKPLYKRLLSLIGLGNEKVLPTDERVIDTYYKRLAVQQVETARVISIRFSAEDPELAAKVANTLADTYISATRQAKFSSNKDAARWLKSEIDDLRGKVDEAERAVERFRAGNGLLQSGRDLSLNQQQLGEINTQLIAARAQAAEARARADLVNRLIKQPGGLDAAAEVLNSRLIQRLRELQAAQSRNFAELSASLLPGHPRMRQLRAEQADIERRIRSEIKKIATGLENEADIATARVAEMSKNLNKFKEKASKAKAAEVKLRALERESKAQRDLLESFLSRYREASARGDMESQPANARIISRATVASTPTYPAKGAVLALASVAAVLLALVIGFLVEFLSPVPVTAAARRPAASEELRDGELPALARTLQARWSGSGDEPALGARASMGPELAPFSAGEAHPISSRAEGETMGRMTQDIVRIAGARKHHRLAVLDLDSAEEGTGVGVKIARAFAEAERKVVLVEAGETRHLATAEGLGIATGLAELLAGDSNLGDVLSQRPGSGLAMISGGRAALPSPLPQDRMERIIEVLQARFDIVIILGGAITADSLPVAAACDLTVLTATAETVNKPGFKSSIEALSGAGVQEAVVITTGSGGGGLYEAISARGQMPDVA